MKKFKQAFTIAELLLCIAIIGVISAMGMTLTRYNVEKAYRSYWQTGYNSLLSIITQSYNDLNEINSANIIKTCNNILRDIPYDPDSVELNRNLIVASNGITYNIGADETTYVPITMTVPSPKTRKNPNGVSQTRLAYIKINDNDGILIPLAPEDDTQIDLRNSELLKFYIDDGLTGRRVFNTGELVTSDDGKKPIISRTFSDAFCHSSEMQKEENKTNINQFFNPNCDGITKEAGVIKPMKPRY